MTAKSIKEANFYQQTSDDTVICQLCPHTCKLKPRKTGLCGSRSNDKGKLIANNYGLVSSLSLDPIEKKPLKRFMPGNMILSAGSYGCNFRCPFCQNHDIAQPQDGPALCRYISPQELAQTASKLEARGNIGLAFTYNEPLTWYEYIMDTAAIIKSSGLKIVLVTNGFINEEPLKRLIPLIDAANIDLKGFSEDFYHRFTGGSLAPVMRTIEMMARSCHIEITTLIIPGLNDSAEQMHAQAKWLASISPEITLHLSRFFPHHRMMDRQKTPAATLYGLQAIAEEYLKYVYLGNI